MLGLHIIHNPANTYSYVGTIPLSLAVIIPADKSAVISGRAWRNAQNELVTYKFPVFKTAHEAQQFALSKGCPIQSPDGN